MGMRIESHKNEVLEALHKQAMTALYAVGETAEGYAKDNCPVDTGKLRNSIAHDENEEMQVTIIGTSVEYAPYIEYGTGVFASNGLGRKTPWAVKPDGSGKYKDGFYTKGVKPTHFLKKAITEHRDEYMKIIEAALK